MILIGTDEGIYRWFEGLGWPIFHSLQDRPIVGLDSPRPGVLVAIDRSGSVFESTNNGMDWRSLPLPAGVERASAITVMGDPSALMVGVRPLGLLQRTIGAPLPRPTPAVASGGSDWVSKAKGVAESASALIERRRARSTSSARANPPGGWLALGTPSVPRTTVPSEIRSLVILGGEPSRWLATVNNAGLWRSEDQGQSWSQCLGLPSGVHAIRPVPGKAEDVWAATSDGVWFSTDAGKSWEDRSAGLEAVRQVRALAVNPGDLNNLLAGAAPAPTGNASPVGGLDYALYESKDAGKSWAKVVKRNFPESLEYDTISDLQFDPAAPENVLAALGSGELWVTRNGGAYWGPLARQIRAARVLCAIG